jgi:hypothetical protein
VAAGQVDVAVAIGAEKLNHQDKSRAFAVLTPALDQDRLDEIHAELGGDRRGAEAALTQLIDLVSIAATPATPEKDVARFAGAGVDTLVAIPFGDRPAVLDALAGVSG